MPILINKESGLAENLPDASLQQAIQAGTHEVPLYNPEGEFGSVPFHEAADLVSKGYTQPNSEQLQEIHKYGKYSTGEQQAKAFAEGAASAATFGLSTKLFHALGAKDEDVQGRREIDPIAHGSGEAFGLVTSLLAGVGEGAVLGRAGELGAAKLGLGAEEAIGNAARLGKEAGMSAAEAHDLGRLAGTQFSAAGRVGSAVAKGAIENMIYASGDEASKMFTSDPHQSVETAISDIGLAGLLGGGIGGAIGGTSELWKMGPGKNLESFMHSIKQRTEGLPSELKEASGINIPPEIDAALSGDPRAARWFQTLQESNSKSGLKAQEALNSFRQEASDVALSALGKVPEDLDAVHHISDYDTGKQIKDVLSKRFSEIAEPISKKYDEFAEKFKSAPLTPELKANIANSVADKISDLGLEKAASDVQLKTVNKFLEVLPKQENAHDLRLLATNLTESNPFGSETYRVGKMLKGIINDAQESALGMELQEKAPQLLSEYKDTQTAYRGIKGLIEDLNDRIHVGKSYGPSSFIENIKSAAPEDILRRLSPKGDMQLQNILQQSFPEVSDVVKANELNKLLKSSLNGGELSLKKLNNNIERMGQDMRNYVLNSEQLKKLGAINEVLNRIPNKLNTSGTARTLDKLWSHVPASAAGMGAMIMGHNPAGAMLMGYVANQLGREVPDAVRLSMLKFLGSSSEVSAQGMQAMTKLASATIRGEKMLESATKNIFTSGGKVIQFPSPKSVKVLEEQVRRVAENDPKQQEDMMSIGGAAGHYLPDHGAALGLVGARNLQYLASIKPHDKGVNPLDSKPRPNSEQLGEYQRALQIAQQPLVVLNDIKKGVVTKNDMQHLTTMYPALYGRMNQKLMNQMTDHLTSGGSLPYSTKLGLSTFLNQPLDSSLMPVSMQSTQNAMRGQTMQMPNNEPAKPTQNGLDKLSKMPNMYQTPTQKRELQRGGRH